MTRHLAPLFALCLAVAPSACRTSPGGDPSEQPVEERSALVVVNENFSDVDIHIVRSGLVTRLGRVNAGATHRFVLSPALVGPGDVSFLATPALGGGRFSTGSLMLMSGRSIHLRVAPVINQSMVTPH